MSDPVVPAVPIVASPPVTVVPKTAAQQKRSAYYTWAVGFGLLLPGVFKLVGEIAPQLKALFPRHSPIIEAVCSIASGIGALMLASQRQQSAAGGDAQVNNTEEVPQ